MEQLDFEKLPYWQQLTEDQKQLFKKRSNIKLYKKGQIIHGGENECLGMIWILKGEIRTYILSDEGREITLFRLYSGDTCVLSAACAIAQITFETQMIAQEDCRVLILDAGAFSLLTEQNIYARCYMYELLVDRFSSVMWTMQQILFMGFDRRLSSFLLNEYERTGSRDIKMTHEQIAQHTSSAREVVARMLKRFAADGLVEYKRGVNRLKDVEGIKKLA